MVWKAQFCWLSPSKFDAIFAYQKHTRVIQLLCILLLEFTIGYSYYMLVFIISEG